MFHIELDMEVYQNHEYETFNIIWFEDMTPTPPEQVQLNSPAIFDP